MCIRDSFMGWADAARQLLVMTNADNPRDAQQAVCLLYTSFVGVQGDRKVRL